MTFLAFGEALIGLSQPTADQLRIKELHGLGYQVKASIITTLMGGTQLSGAFGFWAAGTDLQPSLNTSVNYIVGRRGFGCRNHMHQKHLYTVVFTPMLTAGRMEGKGLLSEINPFYLGYSSAVLNPYRSSFTLGTSFVASPKSTDKNIQTARNRSQQLIYLGLKGGWADGYFELNLYEDFLGTDNSKFNFLADNRDRFYTGGGNIQLAFHRFYKLKYYTETYTGSSNVDHLQYPPLVDSKRQIGSNHWFIRLFAGPRRNLRYSYQDPGQSAFNQGRDVVGFTYTGHVAHVGDLQGKGADHSLAAVSVYMGWRGKDNNMWSQNLVHNFLKLDKNSPLSPDCADGYHRFKPNKDGGTRADNYGDIPYYMKLNKQRKYNSPFWNAFPNLMGAGIEYGFQ